jgi:hypothetical protein
VTATKATLNRLVGWAERWPERVWAVEGASGLGRLLAQQLVARQETVLDVPATLAARARLLARGNGRKTDGIDAGSVARVAQSQPDLWRVGREDHSGVLRLLSDRRDELTQERHTIVNRLHRLLRDLHPGGAPTNLSAAAAASLLGRIRPVVVVDLERKAMARVLVADLRRVDQALVVSRARCATAVTASGTSLTGVFGIATSWRPRSWVTPATSLASPRPTTSQATRTPPPIETSSGEVRAPPAVAKRQPVAQHCAASRRPRSSDAPRGAGRDHYERKLAEHKSSREALRSLKRQLAKVVYRRLVADRDLRLGPVG